MTKPKGISGPHFEPQKFGKRLQRMRNALGITQEELAERLSVDRNHITRMERGIRVCSVDLLVELAVTLDVSTDYLLVGASTANMKKQALLIAVEELESVAQTLK